MDSEAAVAGCRCQVIDQFHSLGGAVDGVLQTEQSGDRVVLVGLLDGSANRFGGERTVPVDLDRPRSRTTEGGRARHLVSEDVVVASDDVLVAALAVAQDRCEVALGSSGEEEGSLLAGQLGHPALQGID